MIELGRTRAAIQRGWRRWRASRWPISQQVVAATVAWLLASRVVDHHQPFFAPIAAIVALNAAFGERGANALKLLLGVFIGIAVGEATIAMVGGGVGRLPVALLIAMSIAAAIGGACVTIAQAAIGVILTVTVSQGEAGLQRVGDALIGGGVALVFSQLLFPPNPLALVRRAEGAALERLGRGLRTISEAIAREDEARAAEALRTLWRTRDLLSELGRARQASTRVANHSLRWRARRDPVVRATEDAAQLDSVAASCQTVARAVLATSPKDRPALVAVVAELASVMEELSGDPASPKVRQDAARRAATAGDSLPSLTERELTPDLAAAVVALQLLIDDLLIFAGVEDSAVTAPG